MILVSLDKDDYYKESEVFHTFEVHLSISPMQLIHYSDLLELNDRYEWYLSFIEKGYQVVANNRDIPLDMLMSMNDSFRENDYKNEWLFKRIIIEDYKLCIYLKCYFTTFDFRLELEAYDLKQTHIIAKGIVLRTMPDEICFSKDFRKVVVRGDSLIIKDFLDKDSFDIKLDRLTDGVFDLTDKRSYQPDETPYLKRIQW